MFIPENLIPTDIPATWGAMEKLYYAGKARAIGVSNFSCKKLQDLLAVARVPPAVNQVECHPVWQQDKLRKLCQSTGVHLSVSFREHLAIKYSSICFQFPLAEFLLLHFWFCCHITGVFAIRLTWITWIQWPKRG